MNIEVNQNEKIEENHISDDNTDIYDKCFNSPEIDEVFFLNKKNFF